MLNSVPPHVSLSLSAARLRHALRDVQDLVRAGRTSGTDWEEANARQALAERAWRVALSGLKRSSYYVEHGEPLAGQAARSGGE